MCYFRADSHRAAARRRVSHGNSRGVAKNGEKGWRTDEVGSSDTHLQDTGLSASRSSVFDSLGGVIKKSLRGNGLFTMPGLLKMKVVKKPATKAREGINPFTGEKMMFQGQGGEQEVRVMPLKSLKGMVNQ